MKVTIGGNRLGSGGKMTTETPTYNRSTHDQSYIWRSTMGVGTLVPFLTEVALRGDTWDIDLECEVLTQPTIGPLFGSMKVQLDVFTADVRLYQGQLHNNAINIGMKMANVKLPQIVIEADNPNWNNGNIDNEQINPSCILKYLGISGIGNQVVTGGQPYRYFNALSLLSYWDIYKNYYANKQEEIGAVIHGEDIKRTVAAINYNNGTSGAPNILIPENTGTTAAILARGSKLIVTRTTGSATEQPQNNEIIIELTDGTEAAISDMYLSWTLQGGAWIAQGLKREYFAKTIAYWRYIDITAARPPQVVTFDLVNLDKMREDIIYNNVGSQFLINSASGAPYSLMLRKYVGGDWSKKNSQEGLGIKTYQSDIFNNWIQTEWIDGDNGVNAITAIDTSDGEFTIDTLIMARKVYNMLNAVAISGGTYYDWMNVNWEQEQARPIVTPVYHGGLSKELVFQEVISTAAAVEGQQPLGTLGGRGKLNSKHKGGKIRIKANEPTYIIGIVSITPRIDYSQGNRWDTNLKTMDDFHKPALDNIGYQDLVTDKMAWWDTTINQTPGGGNVIYRSAGKQPAWLDYMTNYNRVYGNFAEANNQGWMVLNRNYQPDSANKRIMDLTTYIDPMLFNSVFAETARDAMNYWVQIGVNIESRKLMSAKMMPHA